MSVALDTHSVEKPWGRTGLPAPFQGFSGQIGEVWFVPPAELDALLVKYIFTSDKLSVQVHPSDAQTQAAGLGTQGKEECWLVLDAEPGATLGIGFADTLDADTMRAAALDGRIGDMLVWHPVQAGDFFYIPANTVHAIGAGVSLIEVQQNSDITYRLFDYGRPRELHLDAGIAVSLGERYDDARFHRHVAANETASLADGPFFRLDQIAGQPTGDIAERYGERPLLAIPRSGTLMVDGEAVMPGGCGLAQTLDAVSFAEDGLCLIAQPVCQRV